MEKYPNLFSSITLAGTVFRNRIFSSPTGPAYMTSQHFPLQETNAYYEVKAIGGAASVCVGDAVIDSKNARFNNGHLALDNPAGLAAMSRLSEAITRHGAVASIELSHSGSHSHSSAREGIQLYGPMEYTTAEGYKVLPMTEEIIYEIVDKYVAAALYAKSCGFGMVTIHGGHGWLLTEFMSPVTNQRTDKWGGSVENRCRFAVEVCKAVRRAVGPKFPIEMRISGSECNPNGYDLDEGVAIAKQLDGHLDLIHVSAGSHEVWDVFTVTHPDMFLPDGANVKYAAEIKKHVKTAVATVGALADPELMEEIIATGQADVVQLARGLMADPDLPIKAWVGREKEVNKCMRCLTCFSTHMMRGQWLCPLNPELGHELDARITPRPAVKKKVLVAGGGVGGMQAAITAAERGHEVILCEKSGKLGGVLNCEHDVPFKKPLAEYLERQAVAVKKAGVDVRLGTEVTPELAKSLSPDVLIAALGASPAVPKISGTANANVFSAEDIYNDVGKAGKKVVILGGGLVGTELAIYLAQLGREVTILEMAEGLHDGGNMLHGLAIRLELERRKVSVSLSTEAVGISGGGVVGKAPSGEKLFEADTVVYAVGQTPKRAEAEALRSSAAEFHQIGDCLDAQNITEATRLAYHIAKDIGRY
ncbi:MAG: NAD(P)/FAD-dependent oxidoreductase [Oscillospiraceae bacterium]|nr:NAD(P)/FAD-dependent oxidoreductase [Oscillospiraceae bacterium]